MVNIIDKAKVVLGITKPSGKTIEYGSSGTSIFGGILNVEFNSKLQGQDAIAIYDQMRRTDGTIIAILEAIKMPLLSAEWSIKAGGEEDKDKEVADFVSRALFNKLDFLSFLREALGYLEFGYYPFEKVFEFLSKDDKTHPNMIVWKKFAPRVPSSLYLWEIKDKPWNNGHPAGITQQLCGSYDNENKKTKDSGNMPEIPWEKLILFTNKKEGDNFEGISLLRPVYKHWFYKDVFYKIAGISAERFGVGIPYAKMKKGANDASNKKVDEMLQNIKGNEQAFARISADIEEWGIKTPDGDPKASAIDNLINHHDRKIYDAALAGFLNLTSGDGGSNALSKDQSSFFLRALQGIANYIQSVLNPVIKELVDKNYTDIDVYPTLEVSDIGSISMDEAINSISTAVDKNLISLVDSDINIVRDILKLPQLSEKELEAAKKDKEEKQQREEEREDKVIENNKAEAKVIGKEEDIKKKTDEELTKKVEKLSTSISGITESIKLLSEVKLAEKKNLKISKRERIFTSNITGFENFLDSEYDKVEKIVAKYEQRYRKGVQAIYEAAPTERVDGVVVLKYDRKLIRQGEKFVDDLTKKLESEFIDSKFQDDIFKNTAKMAVKTFDQNEKEFSISSVILTATSGYKSNMVGIFFNEPRRIKEAMILNFGTGAAVKLAIAQANQISFNRNILRLSAVTHARSAFNGLLVGEAQRKGFTFFKILLPSNKGKDISPAGIMASSLFMIGTVAMINKRMSKNSEGKNSDTVKGLGLHHGSYEYYYPIESEMLDEEEQIAREQRRKFNE